MKNLKNRFQIQTKFIFKQSATGPETSTDTPEKANQEEAIRRALEKHALEKDSGKPKISDEDINAGIAKFIALFENDKIDKIDEKKIPELIVKAVKANGKASDVPELDTLIKKVISIKKQQVYEAKLKAKFEHPKMHVSSELMQQAHQAVIKGDPDLPQATIEQLMDAEGDVDKIDPKYKDLNPEDFLKNKEYIKLLEEKVLALKLQALTENRITLPNKTENNEKTEAEIITGIATTFGVDPELLMNYRVRNTDGFGLNFENVEEQDVKKYIEEIEAAAYNLKQAKAKEEKKQTELEQLIKTKPKNPTETIKKIKELSKDLNLGKDKDKVNDKSTQIGQSVTQAREGYKDEFYSLYDFIMDLLNAVGYRPGKEKPKQKEGESNADYQKRLEDWQKKQKTKQTNYRNNWSSQPNSPADTKGIEAPNGSAVQKAIAAANAGNILGAKHCTDWVSKVYGVSVHSLRKVQFSGATNKHGDFVTKVGRGTGLAGNGGASVEDINKMPAGTHIMIDHCRGGSCGQGKTHSAILLEQPSNGKARVASYPGGGKKPRIENYTFSQNGSGNSKRVIRAHYPPS